MSSLSGLAAATAHIEASIELLSMPGNAESMLHVASVRSAVQLAPSSAVMLRPLRTQLQALIVTCTCRDLEFPHHENELAQSQAASCSCDQEHMLDGTDFVRLWVHNGFVNGEH